MKLNAAKETWRIQNPPKKEAKLQKAMEGFRQKHQKHQKHRYQKQYLIGRKRKMIVKKCLQNRCLEERENQTENRLEAKTQDEIWGNQEEMKAHSGLD